VALISDLSSRLGLDNLRTFTKDLLTDRPEPVYDAVLLDSPCSGLGTVGRKSDLRWSKSEDELHQVAELQGQLIRIAARYVRPGGVLVYSTCSVDRGENEEIVGQFLAQNSDFEVSRLDGSIDSTLVTGDGFYRAWPHLHSMAGAFAARLIRGRG
jgi:16S rRNA (cytosine967-C5)-methyltransferase